MKKLTLTFALGVTLALAACQQPAETPQPEDGFQAAASPAVWVVKDKDSKLFMIGTVPLVKPDMDWETPAILLAASQADTLILAADPSEGATVKAMELTRELGFYSDGTKLSDSLDETGKKQLDLASTRSEIIPGSLENVKPWVAAVLLGVAAGQSEGLVSENIMVETLLKTAEIDGQKVIFLSSQESRIRDIADLPEGVHLKFLDRTLNDFSGLGASLVKSADAWQKGDLTVLRTGAKNLHTQLPASHYQALIKGRNNAWIEKLENFMEGQGTGLAIVDIPHLVDPGNLQIMLREKGYKVERYYGVD